MYPTGHAVEHLDQVGRLVAPVLRLRPQAARQQVGRVAFQHETADRDLAYQIMQVGAAALVVDPAGDADVQVEVEVAIQRPALAGETMYYGGRQAIAEVAQDRQQALAGVAFVEEHRTL